ncbi:hypothetical protein LINPERHAP2_LOCUS4044, partial [Linum perenne]
DWNLRSWNLTNHHTYYQNIQNHQPYPLNQPLKKLRTTASSNEGKIQEQSTKEPVRLPTEHHIHRTKDSHLAAFSQVN